MLIDSPRFKPGDREAWERLVKYDQALSASARLEKLEAEAIETIQRFFAVDRSGYVSTSWGKDSTVVAHLLARSGVDAPLCWVRVEKWENPDCPTVRDQFLARHPQIRYYEYEVEATAPRWWESGADDQPASKRTSRGGFTLAEKDHGKRHVSGIRAEESRIRRLVQARWGDASHGAARPIGRWDATDVFAYLHKYDLPIHPAYAMSYAGRLDRRWLRVSSLGGIRGSDRGRAEWEHAYYPEVIGLGLSESATDPS